MSRRLLPPILLLAALAGCASRTPPKSDPPRDRWLAEDKAKHFIASFVATTLSASAARAAGFPPDASSWVGIGVGSGLGVWKELRDARLPDASASYRDLVWDLAGVGAGAAVMSRVR